MKNGEYVEIKTNEGGYRGIVMPSPEGDEEHVIIKLDNGYNIGVSKDRIKSVRVLKAVEAGRKRRGKIKAKEGLPKITILHTGGTIASRVDYRTGAVYSSFTPEDLLELFPELGEIANIDSRLIRNMWSDDLRFKHFSIIAEAVKREVERGARGVIIGMGTDNLAVASAALEFIFEEIPIPVILVGAQRSSDRGSSDAGMNLICAARFIANTDFTGVAICMHETMSDTTCGIFPPCKTYKLHSSRRDAFKPVNDKLIARVWPDGRVEFLKDYKRGKKLVMKPRMEDRVGLIKVSVNMFPEQFLVFKGFKGLVMEGTGLGHTPGHAPDEISRINTRIMEAIKEVIDSGCVVVMTTQCLFGRVNMNVYDKGKDLLKIGVIPGEDMLPTTALVKLSWLLANYPKEEVKKLVRENLRGEIS